MLTYTHTHTPLHHEPLRGAYMYTYSQFTPAAAKARQRGGVNWLYVYIYIYKRLTIDRPMAVEMQNGSHTTSFLPA